MVARTCEDEHQVIYMVDLVIHHVMNYPTSIYGSSVIYTVDLYRDMNYPMNI